MRLSARTLFPISIAFSLLAAFGCGDGPSPADRVLLERQKFSVELLSWAPVGEEGQLALDLQVHVAGKSDLETLTVEVRQVGPAEDVVRVDRVPLEVAGMEFDDQRTVTTSVPLGEGVAAVAVVLENVPAEDSRSAYPEFSSTR
jgi:hypothetical protein